jgi:hypothetical protein
MNKSIKKSLAILIVWRKWNGLIFFAHCLCGVCMRVGVCFVLALFVLVY